MNDPMFPYDPVYQQQLLEYERQVRFEKFVNWVQLIAACLGIIIAIRYLLSQSK